MLLLQSSAFAAGGWLFWEMDGLVKTPLNEETVTSAKTILAQIPLCADKGRDGKKREINFIFSAKQGEIDEIMAELNWHKLNTNFKKSFFLTVKDLLNGKNSTHFPPALKHYLNKKIQDLSYGKVANHQRIEFYVWRLPYRTADYIPLWAAAYLGKTARQRGSAAARKRENNAKQPSKIVENKKENQTTFINSLRKLSGLKITEPRRPNRDKNIIFIKKDR